MCVFVAVSVCVCVCVGWVLVSNVTLHSSDGVQNCISVDGESVSGL